MPKKVQRHRFSKLNGEDVVACFTGFDSSQSVRASTDKCRLDNVVQAIWHNLPSDVLLLLQCRSMRDTIERLGGTYQGHFTAEVTHLVANSTNSAKYQVGCKHRVFIETI